MRAAAVAVRGAGDVDRSLAGESSVSSDRPPSDPSGDSGVNDRSLRLVAGENLALKTGRNTVTTTEDIHGTCSGNMCENKYFALF